MQTGILLVDTKFVAEDETGLDEEEIDSEFISFSNECKGGSLNVCVSSACPN
ncbi:hypothetical protein L798_15496 [Zootermopsis nevadensis]|uniref:Uncharacterized protein n=1 Tax=Zootermopsis nevadensis TaxID=136037 RepID=A0A067QM65_ZOONE|nr:hypothetical protein L798_15496 [Zootermopsis nevadensis]